MGSIAPARSVVAYLRTHAVAAMPSDLMFMWVPCTCTFCGPVREDGSRGCEARVDPWMQHRVDGHTVCLTCLECCFLKRWVVAGEQKTEWEAESESKCARESVWKGKADFTFSFRRGEAMTEIDQKN